MKRLEVSIGTLVFSANPDLDEQLQVDYLSDSREVVMTRDFSTPFLIEQGDEILSLHIGRVELHLSADAVSQLIGKLPPEMLH